MRNILQIISDHLRFNKIYTSPANSVRTLCMLKLAVLRAKTEK